MVDWVLWDRLVVACESVVGTHELPEFDEWVSTLREPAQDIDRFFRAVQMREALGKRWANTEATLLFALANAVAHVLWVNASRADEEAAVAEAEHLAEWWLNFSRN